MSTNRLREIHNSLAIKRTLTVRREEYLDYLTFQRNDRPLFTELFGPIIGLKEEWAAQGATPAELDFSAFRFRWLTPASPPASWTRALSASRSFQLALSGPAVFSSRSSFQPLRSS